MSKITVTIKPLCTYCSRIRHKRGVVSQSPYCSIFPREGGKGQRWAMQMGESSRGWGALNKRLLNSHGPMGQRRKREEEKSVQGKGTKSKERKMPWSWAWSGGLSRGVWGRNTDLHQREADSGSRDLDSSSLQKSAVAASANSGVGRAARPDQACWAKPCNCLWLGLKDHK